VCACTPRLRVTHTLHDTDLDTGIQPLASLPTDVRMCACVCVRVSVCARVRVHTPWLRLTHTLHDTDLDTGIQPLDSLPTGAYVCVCVCVCACARAHALVAFDAHTARH